MTFNLENEYGHFVDLIVESLESVDIQHYGVKGMKWGVRKQRSGRPELVGLGPDTITRTTKSGETVTLTKNPPNAFMQFMGRHSTKYTNSYNNAAYMSVTNSTGKKIGTAQVHKKSADELNLVWLGIDKGERGKGYASAIMAGAVEFGRQEGFKKLTLEVPGNAPDARHIYEKQGFKVGKTIGPKDDPVWGGLTEMTYDINQAKHASDPERIMSSYESVDDILMHYGVKGMKWGVRKARTDDYPGASRKTNKEARADAAEFARAKMFYGEGAGTRRKLVKAKVETKGKKDPTYKGAFDHHLKNQDLGKHAEKARGERRRKDVVSKTGKTARGVNRAVNGPFAASLTVTAIGLAAQTQKGQQVVSQIFKKSGL